MKKLIFTLAVIFALTNISCSVLNTISNISRLQFKLGAVNQVMLNGISIEGKTSISDFSTLQLLQLAGAVAKGTLPVSFIINVEAKNPNDGSGNYQRTDIGLSSFPWKLFIDGKETISGNIKNPVEVPGAGKLTNIPLSVNIDLIKFFGDRDYKSLLNMVLAVAGNKGSSSKLELYAQPTISTVIGSITYPKELKIVSAEFTN